MTHVKMPARLWQRTVTFTIPIRVMSEANQRDHWAKRFRRKQQQQELTRIHAGAVGLAIQPGERLRIALCAVLSQLMDSDNLAGAFKHVRDTLAALIGLDDGSDRLEWVYTQRKKELEESPFVTVTINSV